MATNILLSLQTYLLTLVMTPFGLVAIPQGMSMLKQNSVLALSFYIYLLLNPVLFRIYLQYLKRRPEQHQKSLWGKRKQWIRGVLWTFSSHLIAYEMVFLFVTKGNAVGLSTQVIVLALSSIALLILGASTAFLTYKHAPGQQEEGNFSAKNIL